MWPNARRLRKLHGHQVEIQIKDVRDRYALKAAVRTQSAPTNLPARPRVTTSVVHPLADFEVNSRGTLELLERACAAVSTCRLWSTLRPTRCTANWRASHPAKAIPPITWTPTILRPEVWMNISLLDFHSPYGCSKGAAEQYVVDYARVYKMPNTVFRMSCIYGPHQFGTEDQGWVAHFLISTLLHRPITIYGNGKQVRDVLYIDDLVRLSLPPAPTRTGWPVRRSTSAAAPPAPSAC
ncbi:MAG: NAD-dependent epimerase/dehydratase family protein [Caldilineaceae bacterium]